MIAHGKDIKVFSGNSNKALAEAICREMGTQLGLRGGRVFRWGKLRLHL